LPEDEGVQLIFLCAAIREILKKEIYRADKRGFCDDENKGLFAGLDIPPLMNYK
jgi:hypothetical protein